MHLADLRVYHAPKTLGGASALKCSSVMSGMFYVQTCQRSLWVGLGSLTPPNEGSELGLASGLQLFEGQDAYHFLLRFLCGLESEIAGETDVFGQFKSAWSSFEQTGALIAGHLQPWVHRLFEDSKEMRSCYLQNLGGSSYGSLVRRLIKNECPNFGLDKRPVVLIGAGQLAQAVAPYFIEEKLVLANRNVDRLDSFYQALMGQFPKSLDHVRLAQSLDQLENYLSQSKAVIFCIPASSEPPQALKAGNSQIVLHLGGHQRDLDQWAGVEPLFALDDLFSLQHSLGNIRSVQIARARKACAERSILRSLGTSLCISHGWEDLASFA